MDTSDFTFTGGLFSSPKAKKAKEKEDAASQWMLPEGSNKIDDLNADETIEIYFVIESDILDRCKHIFDENSNSDDDNFDSFHMTSYSYGEIEENEDVDQISDTIGVEQNKSPLKSSLAQLPVPLNSWKFDELTNTCSDGYISFLKEIISDLLNKFGEKCEVYEILSKSCYLLTMTGSNNKTIVLSGTSCLIGSGCYGEAYHIQTDDKTDLVVKIINLRNWSSGDVMDVIQRETLLQFNSAKKLLQKKIYTIFREFCQDSEKNTFILSLIELSCLFDGKVYIHQTSTDDEYQDILNSEMKLFCRNIDSKPNEYEDLISFLNTITQLTQDILLGNYGYSKKDMVDICNVIRYEFVKVKQLEPMLGALITDHIQDQKMEETIENYIARHDYINPLDLQTANVNVPLSFWLVLNPAEEKLDLALLSLYYKSTLKEFILQNRNYQNRNDLPHILDTFDRHMYAVLLGHLCRQTSLFHIMNFIHRDIKPANILGQNSRVHFDFNRLIDGKIIVKQSITKEFFHAYLTDFSVARPSFSLTDEGSLSNQDILSLSMTQVGGKLYMAPEIMNSKRYDEKVDVFSLGLVYYELLTMSTSTNHDHIIELRDHLTSKSKIDLPAYFTVLYPEEADIIVKMLSFDPMSRPTAEQCHEMMVQLMNTLTDRFLDFTADDLSLGKTYISTHDAYLETAGILFAEINRVKSAAEADIMSMADVCDREILRWQNFKPDKVFLQRIQAMKNLLIENIHSKPRPKNSDSLYMG